MPTTDLMDALGVAAVAPFDILWRQEMSMQAKGTPRVRDLGDGLWHTTIRTSPRLPRRKLIQLQARFDALRGSRNSFFMWNPLAEYPQSDPGGVILGAATVQVHSVTDGFTLRLKGLPPGYVLTHGDMMEIVFTEPEQHGLHRIGTDATADGSGVTPEFKVEPALWPSAAADQAVNLKKAKTAFVIMPGSYRSSMDGLVAGQIAFEAIQAEHP